MKPKFKLTRGGVQYFDAGGAVTANTTYTPNAQGMSNTINPTQALPIAVTNPMQSISNAGSTIQGIASDFTAQNGYQANLAPITQTDYSRLLSGSGGNASQGFDTFNSNLRNQNNLAALLAAEGQGAGPNPALAQLSNTTGQNVNNQAALMAGQRGSNANAGLMARQIAQNGAGIQQNAVGQAAVLDAERRLAAQNAAGSLYGTMGNQITGEQNANTGLFTGAAGAQNAQNTGLINNYSMAQGINAQTAQNNANAVNKTTGGLMNGAGSMLSMLLAKGGQVPSHNPKVDQVPPKDRMNNKFYPSHLKKIADVYHPGMADGGMIQVPNFVVNQEDSKSDDSSSKTGKSIGSMFGGGGGSSGGDSGGTGGATGATAGLAFGAMACGGPVKKLEAKGGGVPGKARVKGDSYKNDVVDAKLSPGEIVIPRHIVNSDDPAGNAAKFVAQIVGKDQGDEEDDFKSALKKAISKRKK